MTLDDLSLFYAEAVTGQKIPLPALSCLIDEAGLSVRAHNILTRALVIHSGKQGWREETAAMKRLTMRDVASLPDLLSLRGFGRTSWREVQKWFWANHIPIPKQWGGSRSKFSLDTPNDGR